MFGVSAQGAAADEGTRHQPDRAGEADEGDEAVCDEGAEA